MRSLDLIPRRWLEWEPRSTCHELATIGAIASIGGTLVSAIGGMQEASYQSALARNQAIIDRQKANEAAALAQREAITQERRADLAMSRARAVGAASGTLATSPSQLDIEQGIAGQGGYNALASLYEGMAAARSSNYQAEIDLFKAQRIDAAAPLAAAGTLLSGLGTFAGKRSARSLFDKLDEL